MKKNKAYKFRLYPNSEQCDFLLKTFGCTRLIWNVMLSDKLDWYQCTMSTLKNTPAEYKTKFPFLREVDSLALANVQLQLEQAFRNFWNNPSTGFPKWKSRKNKRNSYRTNYTNGNIKIEDGFLKLPKLGQVKVKQHRLIPEDYKLKSVTVSMTPSGHFYASILYEYEAEMKAVEIKTHVGFDYSMSKLFVNPGNQSPEFPHFYRKAMEHLAKEQRILSHRKKGSHGYEKQRQVVAKLHEKIANQRKDFLHKLSYQIANDYDLVSVENLNMKAMSRTLHFGKSVHDNGWGMFLTMLAYKLADRGKQLIKIDKWYASSQICSYCQAHYDAEKQGRKWRMAIHKWTCSECGTHHYRDQNAAINIDMEGLRTALQS